jgi:hypothetical protein
MIRIVNKKRYNTETSTRIAYWHNGCLLDDFHRVDEVLYRTPKGAWWLLGSGGYSSKYGGPDGVDQAIPMTDNEARSWLEEHNFTSELEQRFADDIEDA